jgi:hypothetical protein
MNTGYDVAQICINGHVITSALSRHPNFVKKFCDKCGAETISKCLNCSQPIQGLYFGGSITFTSYTAPNFCYSCSKPFPWLEKRLEAAKDLSDEIENLSDTERAQLKKSLDEIVSDTPQTTVAATRLKKLIAKSGQFAANAFRDILVDIASEAAKKVIWGS